MYYGEFFDEEVCIYRCYNDNDGNGSYYFQATKVDENENVVSVAKKYISDKTVHKTIQDAVRDMVFQCSNKAAKLSRIAADLIFKNENYYPHDPKIGKHITN